MLNKVLLLGRLGRDPEIRSTSSGKTVAHFSLATHRRYTDAEGLRHEMTEWHRVALWDALAEVARKYLRRGRQILLEGRLQTRSWEDPKTGEKRYMTEVVGRHLTLLDAPPAAVKEEAAREDETPTADEEEAS